MSESDPVLPATAEPGARSFASAGRTWIARLAGDALAGTGQLGLARIALVRFYAEGEESPRYEAIVPAGRFQDLFESELAALLASARPLRD